MKRAWRRGRILAAAQQAETKARKRTLPDSFRSPGIAPARARRELADFEHRGIE